MSLATSAAAMFGITSESRQEAAEGLYLSTDRNPWVYWLQLSIAAGIAHLGLVLNSTAVVIGAMLVSPLMTPIVQVGMSFAVGNLFLTIKALTRVVMSILLVVTFAAAMTKFMPFQEVTPEILARTQPTALDLIVAFFCGLAAAFTVSKGSRETVTAAAGTAIAIALVPPLCVLGFGVGVGSLEIVWGATLLFTANFAAIILVSDVYFLITGFANIDVLRLEESVLREKESTSPLFRVVKRLALPRNLSRWRVFRIALPALFVVAVFFPLSQALERVTWEVHVKKGINLLLDDVAATNQVLSSYQSVSHNSVALQMTIVGDPESERGLTERLKLKLAALSGTEPKVSIIIVPSTKYMEEKLQLASTGGQLGAARLGQPLPFALTPDQVVVNMSPILLRDSLRLSLEKALDWIRESDHEGAWIGWSIVLGGRATDIVIHRLADTDLSEETRLFMAGILQKETGLIASVQERRTESTLFAGANAGALRRARGKLVEDIHAALREPSLSVTIVSPKEEEMSTPKQKRDWREMSQQMEKLEAELDLGGRLRRSAGGDEWVIRLRRAEAKGEKKTTAPVSQSAS